MIRNLKENKPISVTAVYLFIFFTAVYLLTASEYNFYRVDTGLLRLNVVEAIVEKLDLSVPVGMKGADGREYSWFGIGSVILAIPFYIAGKLIGISPEYAVSIINQLITAATATLIYIFSVSLGYSNRASILVSVFYGLGTFAWPLAKQPFDHPVEAFFALSSVYCMYRYSMDRKRPLLLLSAFSLGVAFITRYISVLIIPPLFIMAIMHDSKKTDLKSVFKLMIKDVLLFGIVLMPFVCVVFLYNYYRFGSVFETGYSLMSKRMGIDFFSGKSLAKNLSGFLISPGKGFFYYSPAALLFFFSIKPFFKRYSGVAACFLFIIAAYLIFLSKFSRLILWHGDWGWGPRYIFVLTPFLMIPAAEFFDSFSRKGKPFVKAAVCFILSLSLMIQLAAVSVDFQKYFLDLQIDEHVKFTVRTGNGVPPNIVPPAETYFNWKQSPILAQFRFVYEISRGMRYYKYSGPPADAVRAEKLKAEPFMNIFDFWWVYKYFLDDNYSGFFAAFAFLFIAVYAAARLWAVSAKDSLQEAMKFRESKLNGL